MAVEHIQDFRWPTRKKSPPSCWLLLLRHKTQTDPSAGCRHVAVGQTYVLKMDPGKWTHGPKPAVPWWFNFDPGRFLPSNMLLGRPRSAPWPNVSPQRPAKGTAGGGRTLLWDKGQRVTKKHKARLTQSAANICVSGLNSLWPTTLSCLVIKKDITVQVTTHPTHDSTSQPIQRRKQTQHRQSDACSS